MPLNVSLTGQLAASAKAPASNQTTHEKLTRFNHALAETGQFYFI